MGGRHDGDNSGLIMRVDLDTDRVKWRRTYKSAVGSGRTVTALSVNPSGTTMAVFMASNSAVWGRIVYLFAIRTSDGGHETNIQRYTLGPEDTGEHNVH